MDRDAQIEFLERGESRVRSYVSKWLHERAVREALERRPSDDKDDDDKPPVIERRKVG